MVTHAIISSTEGNTFRDGSVSIVVFGNPNPTLQLYADPNTNVFLDFTRNGAAANEPASFN